MHGNWTRAALAALLLVLFAGSADAARYRYGGYSKRGQESGVVVSVEGGLFNVRNADLVYATSESLQVFGGGVNEVLTAPDALTAMLTAMAVAASGTSRITTASVSPKA